VSQPRTFADVLAMVAAARAAAQAADARLLASGQTVNGQAACAAAGLPANPGAGRSQEHVDFGTILMELQLEVLGEYPNGSVDVYSRHTRKVTRINSVGRMTYPDLVQACGDLALKKIHAGHEQVHGRKTLDEARIAVALFACDHSLIDCPQLGNGVWLVNGRVTLVNGRSAAVYDPAAGTLTETNVPRVGKYILDFSASDGWFDFKTLEKHLVDAANLAWCEQVIKDTEVLFAKWYWPHPLDALLAACLAVCSWVQTVWPWRPQVIVTGGSDSGKTMMFGVLKGFFGTLANFHEKPTEAYVRQSIRNRACVVGVDEFEHDHKRQHVLEMIRVASAGGEIGRGTTDQRGRRFPLRHLMWLSGIESGLDREADRNRCIVFNMQRPPAGSRGKISLPADAALAALGIRQLAVALRHVTPAAALFAALRTTQIPDVPGRLVESFSVPTALLASIRGAALPAARSLLDNFFLNRSLSRQGGADESDLLRAILQSLIPIGRGEVRSVSEVIGSRADWEKYRLDLERHGVALIPARPGQRAYDWSTMRIFFNSRVIRRYLLRRTPWADLDCEQLLERLPGSTRVQWVIACLPTWGIAVPLRQHVPDPDAKSEPGAHPGPVAGELVRNR
jgi:hypothetical protein